jgi:hypothetical protein
MANSGAFNISDIRPDAGQDPNLSPTQLPIRGEKRIIPSPVNPSQLTAEFQAVYAGTNPPPGLVTTQKHGATRNFPAYKKGSTRTQMVQSSDFYTTGALIPYQQDYVYIRLAHRGVSASVTPNRNAPPAVYRFLINPATVQVSRTTLDEQALTRAGWQMGVWGEDMIQITMAGQTAAQYFALGLTDEFQPYTESFRNFEQLQLVFENNGYWFEGEQLGDGALSADFTRRRIKMHSDVELVVGNFVWYGMFDSFSFQQSAETPYNLDFNFTFIAWKERYRPTSPYNNLIMNDVYRGHDFSQWEQTATSTQGSNPANSGANTASLPPNTPANLPALPASSPMIANGFMSPAVASAQMQNTAPQVDATCQSYVPMGPVLGYGTPASSNTFNGVLTGTNFSGVGGNQ